VGGGHARRNGMVVSLQYNYFPLYLGLINELMVMHGHVARKVDTQICTDGDRRFGRMHTISCDQVRPQIIPNTYSSSGPSFNLGHRLLS
jgi:hypothetical protein